MKKYLSEYIKYIDDIIKNGQVTKEILDTHLIKITFFQHERLIHLLVTLFYAIFTLAFLALGTIHYIFFIIFCSSFSYQGMYKHIRITVFYKLCFIPVASIFFYHIN